MRLNDESLIPLYQQLVEEIKQAIESGKYKQEERIPTEIELSETYGVSRITVRRAVDELCTEGYLIKKQGKGTYVNRRKLHRKMIRPNDVQSFSEACRFNNMIPSAKVITRQMSKARIAEQKFFGIPEGDKVIYIQRVLSADNIPIMLENNFFPYNRFKFLEDEDLNNISLFKLLKDKYNVDPCSTEKTTVEIVRAELHHAELLNVPIGEPLFYMNAYFLDENGKPIIIGHQYIVGSRYIFHTL